jgi:hypothetical protein
LSLQNGTRIQNDVENVRNFHGDFFSPKNQNGRKIQHGGYFEKISKIIKMAAESMTATKAFLFFT